MNALQRLARGIRETTAAVPLVQISGIVSEVAPSAYRVDGLSAFVKLGDAVSLDIGGTPQPGEIVRIDRQGATVKTFGARVEAGLGTRVCKAKALAVAPDPSWKGRVINALGNPVDGLGALPTGSRSVSSDAEPPAALRRARLSGSLRTGVRVIDIFCPICPGQRIGIFAGSGVGKSTLLAMLAAARGFDTVVIGLVGERGREVREFIEEALGANRQRAVTVVSTGDESPMMRRMAPKTAMSIAESFRDAGDQVLLIIDSVTRYAHAARDVALAAGEPAVARGYPPSVFSDLPKLLERAGPGLEGTGSITGIFSVLVDGDDHNDPVADAIRGTLDGHLVLDRKIAAQGRYPRHGPAGVSVPSGRDRVDARAADAGHQAARDDRPVRGYARSASHGGLQAGERRRSRPGRRPRAAHLRRHDPIASDPAGRGRVPRSRQCAAAAEMRPALKPDQDPFIDAGLRRALTDRLWGGVGFTAAAASAAFAVYMVVVGPGLGHHPSDFGLFATLTHPQVSDAQALQPFHGAPAHTPPRRRRPGALRHRRGLRPDRLRAHRHREPRRRPATGGSGRQGPWPDRRRDASGLRAARRVRRQGAGRIAEHPDPGGAGIDPRGRRAGVVDRAAGRRLGRDDDDRRDFRDGAIGVGPGREPA